ncbi:hypothetical protein AABB24_005682 [Solanum stoloniferum]|uniref:F-box protein At3g26010-like beta-propeller domain-containing protein n=1 Tax=Solanum stoloniferum TaxID=62892 RepID=A0ABD2UY79_9SOLN
MGKQKCSSTGDVILPLLSKFSTKELIRLEGVSKLWKCLMAERYFVKLQLKREIVTGFFYQGRGQCVEEHCISFLPVAQSETHNNVLAFLPEPTKIFNSCYGLLCSSSFHSCAVPSVYISNPLHRKWRKLHWPNPSRESSITLSFDPFKNPIDIVTKFKVVIATQNEISTEAGQYFSFDFYSSETEVWTRSIETCLCNHNLQKEGSICVQGILYWLTDGNQIIMFDPEIEKSWLVMVPLPDTQVNKRKMCMGEAEGKLHYVFISEKGLQVWLLVDYATSIWELTLTISLEVLDTELQKQKHFSHFEIGEKLECDYLTDSAWWVETLSFMDNTLLIKFGGDLFLYMFESRKMKHFGRIDALGQNDVLSGAACAYTMSLVPLGEA